jgi:hypothetical protein
MSAEERDETMERLRAALSRMRARVNHLPVPEPQPTPAPRPAAPPPPKPWSDTEREPGEDG